MDKKIDNININKLFKEYMLLQRDKAIVICEKHVKQSKKAIENSVSNLRKYIVTRANDYGQKIKETSNEYKMKDENINKIQEEYEKNVTEITEYFDEKHKVILAKREELVSKLFEVYAKQVEIQKRGVLSEEDKTRDREELARLAKEGNLDELEKRTKEIKQKNIEIEKNEISKEKQILEIKKEQNEILSAIRKCDDEIEKNDELMCDMIDIHNVFSNDKFHNINEKYLIILKQKNTVQKALGWLMNKFNGGKRFVTEIIEPLNKGMNNMKENKIPEIKKKVTNETKEILNTIDQKMPNKSSIKESIDNIAKKSYENIIDTTNNYRLKIINNMANTLEMNGREVPTNEKINNEKDNER